MTAGSVYAMTPESNGYVALTAAIIQNAVDEFSGIVAKMAKGKDNPGLLSDYRKLKKWFGSAMCEFYSGVAPEVTKALIEKKEAEIYAAVEKKKKVQCRSYRKHS